MSIASNVNRVTAAGNGSTTAFAFGVPFVANTDLIVILRAADGTETTQTLGTDYTVSGAGNPAGGTVTFMTAPATGVTVVIYRDVPLTQPMNLQDGGPLPASTANGAFDRITMQMQRLYERVARGINLRETDTPGAGMLEAAGNELTGLADGTQSNSAVTVRQLALAIEGGGLVPSGTTTRRQIVLALVDAANPGGTNMLPTVINAVDPLGGDTGSAEWIAGTPTVPGDPLSVLIQTATGWNSTQMAAFFTLAGGKPL